MEGLALRDVRRMRAIVERAGIDGESLHVTSFAVRCARSICRAESARGRAKTIGGGRNPLTNEMDDADWTTANRLDAIRSHRERLPGTLLSVLSEFGIATDVTAIIAAYPLPTIFDPAVLVLPSVLPK
jgi:hypothetical protein